MRTQAFSRDLMASLNTDKEADALYNILRSVRRDENG